MDLWSGLIYVVRPGCDTETISTQVGKVKKRILQVKSTKFDFKYTILSRDKPFKKQF